jgi:hypothetical protein
MRRRRRVDPQDSSARPTYFISLDPIHSDNERRYGGPFWLFFKEGEGEISALGR